MQTALDVVCINWIMLSKWAAFPLQYVALTSEGASINIIKFSFIYVYVFKDLHV
jgi:hypothetical protein